MAARRCLHRAKVAFVLKREAITLTAQRMPTCAYFEYVFTILRTDCLTAQLTLGKLLFLIILFEIFPHARFLGSVALLSPGIVYNVRFHFVF